MEAVVVVVMVVVPVVGAPELVGASPPPEPVSAGVDAEVADLRAGGRGEGELLRGGDAGAVPALDQRHREVDADEEAIIDEFRDFLDDLDPDDFKADE